MTDKPPLTPAEHIARAKEELTSGAEPGHATAHALIAIAELMATNMTDAIVDATTRGAVAATEALSSIFSVFNPGGLTPTEPGPCYVCQNDENVVAGWYCTKCATSGRR